MLFLSNNTYKEPIIWNIKRYTYKRDSKHVELNHSCKTKKVEYHNETYFSIKGGVNPKFFETYRVL